MSDAVVVVVPSIVVAVAAVAAARHAHGSHNLLLAAAVAGAMAAADASGFWLLMLLASVHEINSGKSIVDKTFASHVVVSMGNEPGSFDIDAAVNNVGFANLLTSA